MARCGGCASLFVRELPSAAQLQSIYLEQTYYTHDPESTGRIQAENARRCRRLVRMTAGRKLLDVGCAAGHLLDSAKEAGFDVVGVDQTPHTVAEARARGHRVVLGTLEELVANQPDQQGAYDVVTALDVIEHVPDPQSFLQKLVDLARPGGLVVLSTPNYSGLVARLLGARDPFMIPPEHLNFFTIDGLHALANRAQVRIERMETFGRLTAAERRRQGERFLPSLFKPLHAPFGLLVAGGIYGLNWVKLGIEVEVYLRKPKSAAMASLSRAA